MAVTNKIALAYGVEPDGPEKEAMLLQLLQNFHGYLMKYLVMVVRGTLPHVATPAGKEAKEFLRMLAPRGAEIENPAAVCQMLHLAFKQQTTEEIYDTLVFCFVRAARKYDPLHTEKVRVVCEGIDANKEFTAQELAARVGFDCAGILRSLVRKEFLASIIGKKRKVVGYRVASWPPPAAYFASGPIGFVYVLQIWFRFYLNEHIINEMKEIEASEGMCQLFGSESNMFPEGPGAANAAVAFRRGGRDVLVPRVDGNCVTSTGHIRYMADRSLIDKPLDISGMSLAWVAETTDPLFANLTPSQRSLLYLHFHEELSWKKIGKTLGCNEQTALKGSGAYGYIECYSRRAAYPQRTKIGGCLEELRIRLEMLEELIAELEARRSILVHQLMSSEQAIRRPHLRLVRPKPDKAGD